jgi:RNA polymerase sigma-70 factor, ECF subfamily
MHSVVQGDHAAFRVLLERHGRRMLLLARQMLGANAEAEDVVQEAFVRVWQHAAQFDARRSLFTTWMHRIVVNLCLDRARRPRHGGSDEFDALAQSRADETPDALGQALARERSAAVHSALRTLPARQRAALVLFHFQAASTREGAAVMALSEKAFESLLTRARAALRQALRGYMEEPGEC